MDEWRARVMEAREAFLEDDAEDEANMAMAFEQMQATIDRPPAPRRRPGGSYPGKRPNIDRDRGEMDAMMFKDYFSDNPTYGPLHFRRRYRMRRSLFETIMDKVCICDDYFVQKRDACGTWGLSSRQKITCAIRMLALGVCADAMDEYCRVSESTAMESMKHFCVAVRAEFGDYHLRQPSRADLEKQLAINEERGFPGMFASLDCMHYEWKNCPVAWQGDFGDRDGKKSIILEAIADESLHIWHIFFGLPGSNNDVNVLDRSPLINNMLSGAGAHMAFEVNGQEYNRYYLLADGIYPQWSCFVQTIHMPGDEKRAHFATRQEACRKDVERCFGVLQSRWAIIRNPSRQWSMDTIADIMFACCILHNMIIEDEQDVPGLENIIVGLGEGDVPLRRGLSFEDLARGTIEIENEDTHYGLRGDLIEHLWELKGANAWA